MAKKKSKSIPAPRITYSREKYENAKYNLDLYQAENKKEIKQIEKDRTKQLEKRDLENLKKEKFKQSRTGVVVRRVDAATERISGKISRFMSKRLSKPRRIMRHQRLAVDLGDANYRAPSVLGDENRFFTGHMEEEKRSMFFS